MKKGIDCGMGMYVKNSDSISVDFLILLRYRVTIQSSLKGATMPKQTFFNLPEEKRILILDTAIDEFARNSYDKASLSKIVAKAKIAKGSMYQYFDDKDELYSYLVRFVSEKKLTFIKSELILGNDDFFQLYKDIILAAARFDIMYPRYSSFLYSVGNDSHNPLISKQIMFSSIAFIKKLLEEAQAKNN